MFAIAESHIPLEKLLGQVISRNLPDKDVEVFWYNYKNFILTTVYRNYFREHRDRLIITGIISKLSEELNKLQEQYEWDSIFRLIRNFQLYSVIFVCNTTASVVAAAAVTHVDFALIYAMFYKFAKRWNGIDILPEMYNIKYNNAWWDGYTTQEKYAVTIMIIGKNMPARKYNSFTLSLAEHYKVNMGQHNEFILADCEGIRGWLWRCISIFMFDEAGTNVDASTSILDYIDSIHNFKNKWKNGHKDILPRYCTTYSIMDTKKFCSKLRHLLKYEDFV
jgi:hypothetical protein